ncbi:hypothetical protein [Gordonia sp. ABSL49_1]|uniref:hypothetical protein n=1 Tax=Gordonia sp. ABSL49_1 TaxID=2920941 RepID=UPI001F0D89CA|nr:hypothetical protein [Gordonia sp. ABSL49_1]MCH5642267.1 hypothetical protein [Gordonia sp. ABSL49_1]
MSATDDLDALVFTFPEVHEDAILRITFERTLRVPDDDTTYGLPPSLGEFPVYLDPRARESVIPMWQSEAMWMNFSTDSGYPFLVKIGVGGLNAITGEPFRPEIDSADDDYVEIPTQPWLDGFYADPTTVRQFVAMPLGGGYSVAEQLTGEDDGTIRFVVAPLRADKWAQRPRFQYMSEICGSVPDASTDGMGLGAGGSIIQSIATPIEPTENWDTSSPASAVLRIVNTVAWQEITDTQPPHEPLTIEQYRQYNYPWFQWYDDSLARQGDSPFNKAKTVKQVGEDNDEQSLPDNTSFAPPTPIVLGP